MNGWKTVVYAAISIAAYLIGNDDVAAVALGAALGQAPADIRSMFSTISRRK